MKTPRIFVSYYATDPTHPEYQFATRLIGDLRAARADVVTGEDRIADNNFVQTLNQELPTCQWFLLIETPEALQSPKVQMTVNTALNLVAQRRMQGAFRVITAASDAEEVPLTWSGLLIVDASQDYSKAKAKLLSTFGLKSAHSSAAPSKATSPSPLSPPQTSQYDRPVASPARFSFMRSKKGRGLLVALVALVLLVITGAVLSPFLFSSRSHATMVHQVVGSAHFISTGPMDANTIQGINDGVQVDLSNLTTPTSGKSYYAWLLPDRKSVDTNALLLGKLPIQHGTTHFTYKNPSRTSLLAVASRFLITEDDTNFTPDRPSLDRSTWRYYAEIPQTPNPNDMQHHVSELDLLRYLLVSDHELQKVSLQGGLNIWLFQNTRKVLEWATAARGTNEQESPGLMHRHFIRILDYLDGVNFVQRDVPANTPVLVEPRIALLTSDPKQQELPGYVDAMRPYLQSLSNMPGVTKDQRKLTAQIIAALNDVKTNLEQVHADAAKLVNMSDTQLLDPTTVPLLDDLVERANDAYIGQIDPTTGARQGGTTWIYDHIQSFASLTVEKYSE